MSTQDGMKYAEMQQDKFVQNKDAMFNIKK